MHDDGRANTVCHCMHLAMKWNPLQIESTLCTTNVPVGAKQRGNFKSLKSACIYPSIRERSLVFISCICPLKKIFGVLSWRWTPRWHLRCCISKHRSHMLLSKTPFDKWGIQGRAVTCCWEVPLCRRTGFTVKANRQSKGVKSNLLPVQPSPCQSHTSGIHGNDI